MGNDYVLKVIELATEKGVTELNLSCKSIRKLPSEICKLTNLITLNLEYNYISILPPEIGQLTSLKRLYLGDNQLSELPPEINQLKSLTRLNLRSNELRELPSELCQLTNLTNLDLAGNSIYEVPPEIGRLYNLTKLYLSWNNLSELPPEFNKLSSLMALFLGGNNFRTLPHEISQLFNLMILDLSFNKLSELPSEIGQLTNLNKLDLSWNQLSELPSEIGQLTNLNKLDLSHNQLSELRDEPLPIGIKLTELWDKLSKRLKVFGALVLSLLLIIVPFPYVTQEPPVTQEMMIESQQVMVIETKQEIKKEDLVEVIEGEESELFGYESDDRFPENIIPLYVLIKDEGILPIDKEKFFTAAEDHKVMFYSVDAEGNIMVLNQNEEGTDPGTMGISNLNDIYDWYEEDLTKAKETDDRYYLIGVVGNQTLSNEDVELLKWQHEQLEELESSLENLLGQMEQEDELKLDVRVDMETDKEKKTSEPSKANLEVGVENASYSIELPIKNNFYRNSILWAVGIINICWIMVKIRAAVKATKAKKELLPNLSKWIECLNKNIDNGNFETLRQEKVNLLAYNVYKSSTAKDITKDCLSSINKSLRYWIDDNIENIPSELRTRFINFLKYTDSINLEEANPYNLIIELNSLYQDLEEASDIPKALFKSFKLKFST